MEQEKTLQTLIEKAWALHDKISDEIQYSCNGLGGFCPQHGLCIGFAEDPFAQWKSWIAVREALQVLENLLLSLQVGGFFASPFLGFVYYSEMQFHEQYLNFFFLLIIKVSMIYLIFTRYWCKPYQLEPIDLS